MWYNIAYLKGEKSMKNQNKGNENNNQTIVGYLVPSKKVIGELEYKKCIESQQSHLRLSYCLKEEFKLEEQSDTVIAELKGIDGYHMLEPLYQNRKTGSMIYIDALEAITYDSSEILTSTSAFDVAMEYSGYQLSYHKETVEGMLNKMNTQEKGIAKRK